MVGRQLSRYKILEQIGSGGMAVVYKGVDTSLDREVAVKVLHPHLAGKQESRRRFTREAKAVARLHHRNILEIYDFSGEEAAESFIVTEYIRGKTLRKFGDEQAFHPPEIAAMAVHELASALAHAHAIGVIHRDIKPENVMIREDGLVKVMDFGIARIIDREEQMTMTGALVGSPAHMAPEVIEGAEAGPEADIFSLGTILYWLCTRKLPFAGNNTTQTLKLVLDGAFQDPRLANPAVSDDLAGIVSRCLAREPKDRFPNASALREALANSLVEAGIEHPGEELVHFFADPQGCRTAFAKRLVDRLVDKAEGYVRAGRNPKALDCVNRVLALDAAHPKALLLLERMKRRRRLSRLAGVSVGAVATAIVASLVALVAATRPPPPPPAKPPEPPPVANDIPAAPIVVAALPAPREVEPAPRLALRPRPALKPLVRLPDGPPAAPSLLSAYLSVTVWQIQADVYLDDKKLGVKNITGHEVPAGTHLLSVEHECCETYRQNLELLSGKATQVPEIRMTPKVATATFIGHGLPDKTVASVVLAPLPGDPGAGVWARGEPLGKPVRVDFGKTPSGDFFYVRTLRARFSAVGFRAEDQTVTIRAGEDQKFDVDFEKR